MQSVTDLTLCAFVGIHPCTCIVEHLVRPVDQQQRKLVVGVCSDPAQGQELTY